MKYDLSKKMTRGAERTLDAFSSTLFSLISVKSFEDINVNEICEKSNYPRATFYNYFDDKYDLLNYCWYVLSEEIKLNQFIKVPNDELLTIYFDRIYDLLYTQKKMLKDILRNNTLNSPLANSFIAFLKDQMREIFYTCIKVEEMTEAQLLIPTELLADHYSNTLLLVLEWIFFKQNTTSKETAHTYLDYFLQNL